MVSAKYANLINYAETVPNWWRFIIHLPQALSPYLCALWIVVAKLTIVLDNYANGCMIVKYGVLVNINQYKWHVIYKTVTR